MKSAATEITRREFLQISALAAAGISIPGLALGAAEPQRLIASQSEADLVMGLGPSTSVASYNNQVPGPLLRYRQGERLRLELENQLDEPTTIHWHGLRLPADMDGVPILSQEPVQPGETFTYEFDLHDAGTFWYHPHFNSSKQVGQGLRGVLIVDEISPPAVDRDVVWVLDDWRLNEQAQIVPFDGNLRDASHNGRMGNVVTVNGSINEEYGVHSGERIRLRLVNVANARTFAPIFQGLNPWVIALDGHPVDPYKLGENPIFLGAGQRADLILDIFPDPSGHSSVIDVAIPEFAYELIRLVHGFDNAQFTGETNPPARMPSNPVAKPDVENAERHQLVFEGGAMGGLAGAILDGEYKDIRSLARSGMLWSVNGEISSDAHRQPPLLEFKLGKTYILEFVNLTAFEHPFHLHGHSFEILSNDSGLDVVGAVRDTVLVQPQSKAEVAFVADNPGLWLLHCHVLEHQESGMTSIVAVS